MIKIISTFIISLMFTGYIPQRSTHGKKYLIVGQDSVQKIYYSSSSYYSMNHEADKAMDSDKKTSWISKKRKGPHWIEIDFSIKRLITSIVVYPGKKDNYKTLKSFSLQFMYRDRWFDFTKINLEDENKKNHLWEKKGNKIVIKLGGIDASTFRIFIPKNSTYGDYAAIAEIEAYLGSSKIKYFDDRLKGLYFPIKNGYLPKRDSSYPNAARKYRGGRHVGLDIFYYHEDGEYDPIPITKKTPIYAADDGNIMRADWNYKPMTPEAWKKLSLFYKKNPRTYVMRSFGGIQIWINHKNGIVTTYNHLSRIDEKIKIGTRVKKGQRIGWAGNSGLFAEARGKNYGVHLHFEIWIDGYYLGYGMKHKDVRKYITWIFFQLQ